ncbi:phosphoenolpyruvate synthase [Paraburkholderia sp. SARCC-3016]|uniref:phosphoenolpyruvate synthase n=1 Tax=Paraburkholderia sp. SARCC-3016 TaxID=3058611 RepID=UPI002807C4A2|nr:phosphoenolpyruvate synthase [Paraburkholderia sp. SARCC-3016]MDQ7976832.1 phosphoenolpyruvate synthase [Paraburkholderia sp. SARCC-3016]
MSDQDGLVVWFEDLRRNDVPRVGGKNASLGEMVSNLAASGIRVPPGFATTARAYWDFIDANGLRDTIAGVLGEFAGNRRSLAETGEAIRHAILRAQWPAATAEAICRSYEELALRAGGDDPDVAVRSSATAEDLPDASFAGQQETSLAIRGTQALLDACRRCYASLFTDRAISYREAKGFDHLKVALSIGVQKMVRSDLGASGVAFSIDTETGFDRIVLINAAWGLGENVVQGTVDPDEYEVFKPLLDDPACAPIIGKKRGGKLKKMVYASRGPHPTKNVPTSKAERAAFVLADADVLLLSRWVCAIERHYGRPMDIEWAKDGVSGQLFIVQARPETVQSRREATAIRTFRMRSAGRELLAGVSVGQAIAVGPVCVIESPRDMARFVDGSVLVTAATDPDWVPVMRRASAIVTDHGGRTSHAAIVSRELGLPAIVGTAHATRVLHDEQDVTVSCAQGEVGHVFEGTADYQVEEIDFSAIPRTDTRIMLNLANPDAALRWWRMPADGVGLARMEFVVSNHIRIHPMALAHFDDLKDAEAARTIAEMTEGYRDRTDYFVDRLSCGLGRIAAVCHPRPVIVRLSDFKTNEYAHLIGGAAFEPTEENPMLGFRGASRYYSPRYRDGFALECRALRRLRIEMGMTNVIVMVPFCRTPEEADRVLEAMAEHDLKRGEAGLQIYVMCEIPSNVILADEFARRFDGFSIGSNDLTQLTLGVDRDSAELAALFDERNDAVRWMIREVIERAHRAGAKVGLCGEAPSAHPEYARFLVECGIDSISVSPDSFIAVKRHVAQAEASLRKPDAPREAVEAALLSGERR